MSMEYCHEHDTLYDTDFYEACFECLAYDLAEIARKEQNAAEVEYIANTEVQSADLEATGEDKTEQPRLWPTPDAEPQRGMQMGVSAFFKR